MLAYGLKDPHETNTKYSKTHTSRLMDQILGCRQGQIKFPLQLVRGASVNHVHSQRLRGAGVETYIQDIQLRVPHRHRLRDITV